MCMLIPSNSLAVLRFLILKRASPYSQSKILLNEKVAECDLKLICLALS